MITRDEMKNLTMLARIEMSESEMDAIAHDFHSILNYVEQINQAEVSGVDEKPMLINVAHLDKNPYETGICSDALLADAPDVSDGFYKVPKIL